ncbi:TolB family protein [Arenibacter sp. BSSL-BM3]|uniref:TolB family protein n=1 Tax=Arenibacter arenosicollis TaxID=2762274 RepID=A0ABR7QP49_9FLAO|nr:PD40 domain-containing protein [Arenibacter arenosicollis]MBC8768982.1 TolB family protein [Arenibacter arenosicollis]
MTHKKIILSLAIIGSILISWAFQLDMGIFQGHGDIGEVNHKGSLEFNPIDSTYTISASGTNMWFNNDQLHYVWKKMSGDVALTADIELLGKGIDPHRKACLIIRQNLEPGSAYADVAVHGDGMTAIQYREEDGDITRELQSNIKSPKRVRIEKVGDYLYMSLGKADGELESSGGAIKVQFKAPFYIGLGVCSHNNDVVETAKFSKVVLEKLEAKPDSLKKLESTLEIIPIATWDRKVILQSDKRLDAPNWTPDGKDLIYNSMGLLYQIPIEGGDPKPIPTDFAKRINNDHGVSQDGKMLVISDQTETGKSLIYTLPIEGGVPKKITPKGPSYWHGWSPDGQTLAYCAERNGNYDIYTIPVTGGEETRLTTTEGLDDGPDFSPDGKYIYFNSARSGTMQIWRMKPNGSEQEQLTTDEYHDWFAHPSPDGKWLVYISFEPDIPANLHPSNKDVMLRLMNLETREIKTIVKLFGGQGTINVPSWSPDSSRLAFVSYRLK